MSTQSARRVSSQPVYSPSEVGAQLIPFIARNPSTVRGNASYPSALWASVMFRLTGGTAVAGQILKVVVNASSDADANGKLAVDGGFVALAYGDDITFSASIYEPITRIDWLTEQAVTAETSFLQILAGV